MSSVPGVTRRVASGKIDADNLSNTEVRMREISSASRSSVELTSVKP